MAGMTKQVKMPSLGKLTLKTIIAVVIAMLLFLFGAATISIISEDFVDYGDDTAEMINNCNRYYYNKEYGDLRDSLDLWGLYSEEFDKYWEICDAYELYVECYEYAGLEDGTDKVKLLQAQLGTMAQQCRFAENQNRLNQFYSDVMSLNA